MHENEWQLRNYIQVKNSKTVVAHGGMSFLSWNSMLIFKNIKSTYLIYDVKKREGKKTECVIILAAFWQKKSSFLKSHWRDLRTLSFLLYVLLWFLEDCTVIFYYLTALPNIRTVLKKGRLYSYFLFLHWSHYYTYCSQTPVL